MRLHMILNMPAVLSIHKIGKQREKEKEGGRNSAEVEIPKKGRYTLGPCLAHVYQPTAYWGTVRRLISSSFGRGAL